MAIKNKNYLYFDTTARNPYRLRNLLKIALKYEGQILTNQLCETIVKDLIKFQWFEPQSSIKIAELEYPELNLKEKWRSEKPLEDDEAQLLIDVWKPNHGEAGFSASKKEPHWSARWVTYFRECKVYGLIDYTAPGKGKYLDKYAKPFYITELGKMLIDSIPEKELSHVHHGDLENTTNEEQIIFCHIMAKHKSSNPFRRCSFSNSPFPLLLATLELMSKDESIKSYISLNEVLISLVWPNNDPVKLMDFLKEFRKEKIGDRTHDEIESYVKNKLKIPLLWTKTSSGNSAKDAYWRRLKATGLFLRKGYTIYLDLAQKDLIDYVIKEYLKVDELETEVEYFDYISSIDGKLLAFKQETTFGTYTKLQNISDYLGWDEIKSELKDSSRNKPSRIVDLVGKKASLRYEFICGVAIANKFKNTKTTANCKTDSFGWPIGFASGQNGTNTGADIECFETKMNFIIEPSRGTSKTDQSRECFAIEEHLRAFVKQEDKEAKSFFIAPSLTGRVHRYAEFLEHELGKSVMKNLTTEVFIDLLESKSSLLESFNA